MTHKGLQIKPDEQILASSGVSSGDILYWDTTVSSWLSGGITVQGSGIDLSTSGITVLNFGTNLTTAISGDTATVSLPSGTLTTILDPRYIMLDASNDPITRGLGITGSVDEVQLTILANATQTANVIEQQQSGGTVVIYTTNSGSLKISDKLIFTQADGNEAIDSLADGYMDYLATTAHRFNATIESSGGRIKNTTRVTTTYTALVTDDTIYADTDGGAFTITLPAGAEGQTFRIINCGSSGLDLTIDGDSAETVRGDATQIVSDSEIMIITYNATEGWW